MPAGFTASTEKHHMLSLIPKTVTRVAIFAALFFTVEKTSLAADKILVTDRIGGRVLRFNTDGTYDTTIATNVPKPTSLVVIPGTTQMWVGSTEASSIYRYDVNNGALLGTIASSIGVGDMLSF